LLLRRDKARRAIIIKSARLDYDNGFARRFSRFIDDEGVG
jgi:hypothetical protein